MMKEVMKLVSKNEEAKVSRSTYGYREVPGLGSDRLDVIEQLHANLAQIEDLHARLRFVMSEVRTVMPKA